MRLFYRKQAKENALKKAYDEYYQKMRKYGKQPMTYANWLKSGRKGAYYGSQMREEAYLSRSDRKALGMGD